MLSIIISSYQEHYYQNLEKNIQETCGIEYEIIKVYNPGIMGICEAYNIGRKKAKYQNLLFIHEDTEFETKNWGILLLEELNQPNCGIVGVAGSRYLPNVPIGWWELNTETVRNYTQYDQGQFYRYELDEFAKVEVLDGVFLAIKSAVFDKYFFNDLLQGFHAYDIDLSYRVSQDYINYVTNKIMIRHFSNGSTNQEWFSAMHKFSELRRTYTQRNRQILSKHEGYALFVLYKYLLSFPQKQKSMIFKYFNFKYLRITGFLTFFKFYLKSKLKVSLKN
ncbi:glycosyltransferase [Elizabethkingia meningoseptica]|uniref:glycosyltransferase n=1 Tax=Elizabethkingia meningoseptica TaxID=238 RepID=UPI003892C374